MKKIITLSVGLILGLTSLSAFAAATVQRVEVSNYQEKPFYIFLTDAQGVWVKTNSVELPPVASHGPSQVYVNTYGGQLTVSTSDSFPPTATTTRYGGPAGYCFNHSGLKNMHNGGIRVNPNGDVTIHKLGPFNTPETLCINDA